MISTFSTILRSAALLIVLAFSFAKFAHAQITFGPQPQQETGEVTIRDLNWMNNNYLDKQRTTADQLTRSHLGRQLRQSRSDIALLQKLIDKNVVEADDKQTLQALGAALGDIIENEHSKLNWKVYEDDLGASHAVCLDNSEHCVFPMTMISRRVEAGFQPDVQHIFDRVLTSLKPYFPRLPYSRD
jgi:hypothetical protein